jgi:hypothetical protein
MSKKQLQTIDLKGKAYATVPTRVKEFRELCPNGLIETKPTILNDGRVMFQARILKDKTDPNSGEATGHSIGVVGKQDKDFEKLETIAIGRALGILGFMASGEVASFEEMEEFLSDKEVKRAEKVTEVKGQVDATEDIDELREIFKENRGLGAELDAYIMEKVRVLKEKK